MLLAVGGAPRAVVGTRPPPDYPGAARGRAPRPLSDAELAWASEDDADGDASDRNMPARVDSSGGGSGGGGVGGKGATATEEKKTLVDAPKKWRSVDGGGSDGRSGTTASIASASAAAANTQRRLIKVDFSVLEMDDEDEDDDGEGDHGSLSPGGGSGRRARAPWQRTGSSSASAAAAAADREYLRCLDAALECRPLSHYRHAHGLAHAHGDVVWLAPSWPPGMHGWDGPSNQIRDLSVEESTCHDCIKSTIPTSDTNVRFS